MKIDKTWGKVDKSGQFTFNVEMGEYRGRARLGCAWILVPFFIFLTLKLLGWVSWSWWVVTSPLYAIPAVFCASFLVYGLYLHARGRIK